MPGVPLGKPETEQASGIDKFKILQYILYITKKYNSTWYIVWKILHCGIYKKRD